MTSATRLCPKCGSEIPADAPEGGCPGCLLESGLGLLPDAAVGACVTAAAAALHSKKAERAAEMLGELGDYELQEEVGRGGQGVVFRARQKSLNRTVALKVISLGQWASKAHVKRFRREAEAAASLDHPSIVPIYEVGERDGSCYFTMTFVEGGQLDEVVTHKPMSVRHAAELIAKVARTVHYAHDHGILHRDIKPGNILLDDKGEPHLTDFGLARLVETESTMTRTLEVLGTPSYMAPEQATGNNTQLTSATDVYGLGAVLYQLLTGHPPFAGGTTFETIKLLLDTEPRPPRLLNPRVDRDLSTICLKCLEKHPERRYSFAVALAEDLERWLKHEPIQARRTGIFARGRKWVRRNSTSALLAASLIALAAAAGWIVWKSEFVRHPVTNGIAVLPFESLSPNPDNAYFAEGIQDEILTRLAKIAELKVISRTSTQRYQSKPRNLAEIAKQLGVANILEGSVQKTADKVRVAVQLIEAKSDRGLWAASYDRSPADVFAVQSEIASAVANALHARLTPQESLAVKSVPTRNQKAYDLFLRAEHSLRIARENSLTGDPREAIELYRQAVAEDTSFALAYARLSFAESLLRWLGSATTDQERINAERALALQPDLMEAHLALAYCDYWGSSDYPSALEHLDRAQGLAPQSTEVLVALGLVYRRQLRFDEAIAVYERAAQYDPGNSMLFFDLATTCLWAGRNDNVQPLLERTLALNPGMEAAAELLGQFRFQQRGDVEGARRVLSGRGPSAQIALADTYWLMRDYEKAIRLIEELPADSPAFAQYDRTKDHVLGLYLHYAGHEQRARPMLERQRDRLMALLSDNTNSARAFAFISITLARIELAFGNRDAAVQLAERGARADPMIRDTVSREFYSSDLAEIYALAGRNDEAIALISGLLKSRLRFTTVTPITLRLAPTWDLLREDPRFQALLKEYPAEVR
jgi:serine/threonine protein kinase/lipopolysaccharide biosynthesis regulator YciM